MAGTSRLGLHLLKASAERPAPGPVRELAVEQLAADLVEGGMSADWQLLDVREPWEAERASIRAAGGGELFRLLPTSQSADWAPRIASELDPGKRTVVLCHHGVRSANVAGFLLQQGFTDVWNVTGGIDQWSLLVDASVPRY